MEPPWTLTVSTYVEPVSPQWDGSSINVHNENLQILVAATRDPLGVHYIRAHLCVVSIVCVAIWVFLHRYLIEFLFACCVTCTFLRRGTNRVLSYQSGSGSIYSSHKCNVSPCPRINAQGCQTISQTRFKRSASFTCASTATLKSPAKQNKESMS